MKPVKKPSALERRVLTNVKEGWPAVSGLGEGKTLALAQHAVIALLERKWIDESPSDDPLAAAFVITKAGLAALEAS